MAPRQPLIDRLFAEMRGRIKEADTSVPQKDGAALLDRIRGRRRIQEVVAPPGRCADDGSADELILDEVALAQGHDYFRLGAISVSNDGRLLAWSVDDNGSERFTARIKVIATGEILPDEIPGTNSGLIWVKGDTGLVYSLANENWRTDNVRLHWLGQPLDADVELFHEDDEGFRAGAALSANENG
jgi:oligopeptidase B